MVPVAKGDSAGAALLEARGLVRKFGDRAAVDGLSFGVRAGEAFGLLGPNGAGKTTTFHLLTGLLAPQAGEIFFGGRPVSPVEPSARVGVGVVFQKPSVDIRLTGRENLELGASLYAVPRSQAKERISQALVRAGLAERADEVVEKYSGGMRRRLELERVLLSDPKLLILDEPTQGLDQAAFRGFWEDINALRRERGLTVLLTSHFPEEAEYCDRLAIMDHGKIIALDTPAGLKGKVGGDVVAVEAADPAELAEEIASKFGVTPFLRGEEIRFERERAHELIPRLVEAFPVGRFRSVSIHRPTLGDVFVKLTGRALDTDTMDTAAAGKEAA